MQNKISYRFWGAVPPDPLLQRYNPRVSPSPQQILDLPLVCAQKEKKSQENVQSKKLKIILATDYVCVTVYFGYLQCLRWNLYLVIHPFRSLSYPS